MNNIYICVACKAPARKSGSGLGTWHCTGGCSKRRFTVTRRVDSGKEIEWRDLYRAVHVRRAIAVRRVSGGGKP